MASTAFGWVWGFVLPQRSGHVRGQLLALAFVERTIVLRSWENRRIVATHLPIIARLQGVAIAIVTPCRVLSPHQHQADGDRAFG
ncbi:hypothetical protein GCM10010171_22830 [Actinokineospora fastidiosa]|uniref:Uncharacterized protein n=1 Tax=Actinokineospora fastidiosa TaxID=1816 RepID=A0A918LC70_9PSEU|nr:hypothetical protein GCM10010171_22830 [Actinokineospora fastidiosa]